MSFQKTQEPPAVAISISESPDMATLGLSEGHLQDAMAEIALRLLSSGTSLAYGGDLRRHGFTELLFELVLRYRDHPQHTGQITVTDYLAWPVHIRMTEKELVSLSVEHEQSPHLVFLARDGARLEREQRLEIPAHEPDDNEWAEGLTAMRKIMCEQTYARILLGGRIENYKGCMPGVAEEALLSLRAGQAVFLLGGFGGCTRDIAETLGIIDPWAGSHSDWNNRSCFENYSPSDLHNGLSDEDNAVLARTPYIQQAVVLVSRGLRRLRNGKTTNDSKREGTEHA